MPPRPLMTFSVFHDQRQWAVVQRQSPWHIIMSMFETSEGCLPKGTHTLWVVAILKP